MEPSITTLATSDNGDANASATSLPGKGEQSLTSSANMESSKAELKDESTEAPVPASSGKDNVASKKYYLVLSCIRHGEVRVPSIDPTVVDDLT